VPSDRWIVVIFAVTPGPAAGVAPFGRSSGQAAAQAPEHVEAPGESDDNRYKVCPLDVTSTGPNELDPTSTAAEAEEPVVVGVELSLVAVDGELDEQAASRSAAVPAPATATTIARRRWARAVIAGPRRELGGSSLVGDA